MSTVLFFIAAIGVIAGAVGVVVAARPLLRVLALVVHLISLAVLFLLLRAEFVAAAQVVVYAGAVMVLYVFVVAYVGGEADRSASACEAPAPSAPGCASAERSSAERCSIELLIALLGTGLEAINGYGAGYAPGRRLRHARLHRQAASHPLPARLRDRVLPAADRRRRRQSCSPAAVVASARRCHQASPRLTCSRPRHGHDGRGRRRGGLVALREAHVNIAWYLAVSAIVFSLGRRRRDHPPQPARRAALPGADAQRRRTSRLSPSRACGATATGRSSRSSS